MERAFYTGKILVDGQNFMTRYLVTFNTINLSKLKHIEEP